MPKWFPYVLVVQIPLTLFAPVLQLGSRNVFLGDLWCWLWLGPALVFVLRSTGEGGYKKKLVSFLVWSSVILFITYVHGYFRIRLHDWVAAKYYWGFNEKDHFQAGREFVVFFRFLSWTWAAALSFYFFYVSAKKLKLLHQCLAICLAAECLAIVFSKINPAVSAFLGKVYHYDPNFEYWRGRLYGTFQSPVEAAVAISIACFFLFLAPQLKIKMRMGLTILALLFVLLTRTATPLVGLLALIPFFLYQRNKTKLKKFIPAVLGFAALVALFWGRSILSSKVDDVLSRFQVWQAYLQAAFLRWDCFLFGFGFANYHIDNSFIYILNRSGILGLGSAIYFGAKTLRKSWHHWPLAVKSFLLFFAVIASGLDAIIYRHAVLLLIAVGLPSLATGIRKS